MQHNLRDNQQFINLYIKLSFSLCNDCAAIINPSLRSKVQVKLNILVLLGIISQNSEDVFSSFKHLKMQFLNFTDYINLC